MAMAQAVAQQLQGGAQAGVGASQQAQEEQAQVQVQQAQQEQAQQTQAQQEQLAQAQHEQAQVLHSAQAQDAREQLEAAQAWAQAVPGLAQARGGPSAFWAGGGCAPARVASMRICTQYYLAYLHAAQAPSQDIMDGSAFLLGGVGEGQDAL